MQLTTKSRSAPSRPVESASWVEIISRLDAWCQTGMAPVPIEFNQLAQIFPNLEASRNLTLDERWHGDETVAEVTMAALPFVKDELYNIHFSHPQYRRLLLAAAVCLSLGRTESSPKGGERVELAERVGVEEVDRLRRVRFSGHAKVAAEEFRETIPLLNPSADSDGHFTPAEIALAATWIEYSQKPLTLLRNNRGDESNNWIPQLGREVCSNYLLSEGISPSDILAGIAALARVRHCIAEPNQARRNTVGKEIEKWQTIWQQHHGELLIATKALEDSASSIDSWVAQRRATPLLSAEDWQALEIPFNVRNEAKAFCATLTTTSSRKEILRSVNERFGSRLLTEQELARVASSSGKIEDRFSRFLALASRSSLTGPDNEYTAKYFTCEPLREFPATTNMATIESRLRLYTYPAISRFCASLQELHYDAPLQKILELVTTGPFASLPELERYLQRHVVNPLDIEFGYISQAPAVKVCRIRPLAGSISTITVLNGFQSRYDHQGSGLAHILHQRGKEIRKWVASPGEDEAGAAMRFRDEGIVHVAGSASHLCRSAHVPHQRLLLTGESKDSKYHLTLVLHPHPPRQESEASIVTAIFHRDKSSAERYIESHGVPLEGKSA